MADTSDHTAVRVALWRALHVEVDPAPHVLVDVLGLQLAAPEPGWRRRPDMGRRRRLVRLEMHILQDHE